MSKKSRHRPQSSCPTPASREALPFLHAVFDLVRDLEAQGVVPEGYYVHIEHDTWCGRVQGRDCTCTPFLRIRPRPASEEDMLTDASIGAWSRPVMEGGPDAAA